MKKERFSNFQFLIRLLICFIFVLIPIISIIADGFDAVDISVSFVSLSVVFAFFFHGIRKPLHWSETYVLSVIIFCILLGSLPWVAYHINWEANPLVCDTAEDWARWRVVEFYSMPVSAFVILVSLPLIVVARNDRKAFQNIQIRKIYVVIFAITCPFLLLTTAYLSTFMIRSLFCDSEIVYGQISMPFMFFMLSFFYIVMISIFFVNLFRKLR